MRTQIVFDKYAAIGRFLLRCMKGIHQRSRGVYAFDDVRVVFVLRPQDQVMFGKACRFRESL